MNICIYNITTSFVVQVEVVEVYCDPRDSKAYLEPGQEATDKLYTTPDKEYTHPYHNSGELQLSLFLDFVLDFEFDC